MDARFPGCLSNFPGPQRRGTGGTLDWAKFILKLRQLSAQSRLIEVEQKISRIMPHFHATGRAQIIRFPTA
jgi:hypothetical protein